MRIVLEYRNPSPTHCDVVIWVNGAFTGTLTLRQEELITFQDIIAQGVDQEFDTFTSRGNPDPRKEEK